MCIQSMQSFRRKDLCADNFKCIMQAHSHARTNYSCYGDDDDDDDAFNAFVKLYTASVCAYIYIVALTNL